MKRELTRIFVIVFAVTFFASNAMAWMVDPSNVQDDPYTTSGEDIDIGPVTSTYEETAGWGYDQHDSGGLWNGEELNGAESFETGNLSNEAVDCFPPPPPPNPVPLSSAVWLMGSGLFAVLGLRRRRNHQGR